MVDVVMPQMGVSVSEGTIVEWRKQVGDWVEYEEPIVDISTDKIDTEVPSPAAGRVAEIVVEPGATVEVEGAPTGPRSDAPRRYSPVVQRIAAEHGVDLERVQGTGRGGRVLKQDVLAYLENGGGAA